MRYVLSSAESDIVIHVRRTLAEGFGDVERVSGPAVCSRESAGVGTRRDQSPFPLNRDVPSDDYAGGEGSRRQEVAKHGGWAGTKTGRGSEEGGGGGCGVARAVEVDRGRDYGGRSDESAEMDEQVHAYHRRGADPCRASSEQRNGGRCLEEMGYTLQANIKTREGPQKPNRDAQFRYLNRQVKMFRRSADPVISVDTKKKELVGAFKNAGRRWVPKGKADQVLVHDFPSLGQGKAIPYGAYDIARDRAVVNVGVTHDTAEFAVESIRRWWRLDGKRHYRGAERLLICADSGGSNGNRPRAWKLHLQALSDETGMAITVCHYPPGTSKWNKIEHRLFSFISLNWRGKPLVNFETVVNLIGGTRNRGGLKVKAVLDTNQYDTGVGVSDDEMGQLRIKRHKVHPSWNYTLSPR